jgi:NADH-quinone oxidoreductase subunit J
MIDSVLFYFFALLLLYSALMVIGHHHSIKAILFLLLAFLSVSGIYYLLQSYFLAFSLSLIHISLFFLFFLIIVMTIPFQKKWTKPNKTIIFFFMVLFSSIFWIISSFNSEWDDNKNSTRLSYSFSLPISSTKIVLKIQKNQKKIDSSSIKRLAHHLYSEYLLVVEMMGMLLLLVIIGCIALIFKGQKHQKVQVIAQQQLMASKKNRLQRIQMSSE